jgi:hypothetical protein
VADQDSPYGSGSAGIAYGMPTTVVGIRIGLWLQGCLWTAIALLVLAGIQATVSAVFETLLAAGLAVMSTALGARLAPGREWIWVVLLLLEGLISMLALLRGLFSLALLRATSPDQETGATVALIAYAPALILAVALFGNLRRRTVRNFVRTDQG